MFEAIINTAQALVSGINGWITATLHGNTIIAGAVTASIMGSLFYALRKVPGQLWEQLRKHIFFTHVIEFTPMQKSIITDIATLFEQEVQKNISKKRSITRLGIRNKRLVETLADGSFYHWWDGFFVKIHRYVKPKAVDDTKGSEIIVLNFTTLALHRDTVMKRLRKMAANYNDSGVYILRSDYNNNADAIRVGPLTTPPVLAINHDVRKQLNTAIDSFMTHRDENNRLGIKHKLVIMLYGEPGTGKSIISEYVAHRLNTSLFCVNSNSRFNGTTPTISAAVAAAKDNIAVDDIPLVLCDDVDTIWHIKKRKTAAEAAKIKKEAPYTPVDAESADLGKLLADLQSPTEIRDCVVILNTNHLDLLDPALYRPGRVTLLLEIKRMEPECVKEYFSIRYGMDWPATILICRNVRGCDVAGYYESNINNPQGFINAVLGNGATDEIFQSEAVAA